MFFKLLKNHFPDCSVLWVETNQRQDDCEESSHEAGVLLNLQTFDQSEESGQ